MENSVDEHSDKTYARLVLIVGIFDNEGKATRVVEKLLEQDFAADRISLLHKASGPGDDMLGLIYSNSEERVKVWSKHGIIWGALWGLLAGASGMFIFPSIGALLAAGPIVEAMVSVIAGATIGGGAMAGAAVLTELASALHKMGIPKTELKIIHHAVEQGNFIVILHCAKEEAEHYSILLRHTEADPVIAIPIFI
tara:strand:+ start:59625 stop:60212 length:588 start_codon:yes stop_codon:yes gene_type:complete